MKITLTKKEIMDKVDGKIFKAIFIKKDGTERTMVCRLGIQKYLTGAGPKYDYDNLLCVFDMQKEEYRNINLDTLIYIQCGAWSFGTK